MAAAGSAGGAAIAVFGAGLMGRRHIDLIRRHACLAALVDPAPEARALAGDLGAAWFASVDECLGQARLDGAIVATPNSLHLAQALACLEAGVPALIEKPVTETAAEGERLVEALKRGGAPVLVGHHRRHNPLLRAAARAIREGAIGRVVTGAAAPGAVRSTSTSSTTSTRCAICAARSSASRRSTQAPCAASRSRTPLR